MNNLGAIANIEGKWAEAMALYNLAVSAHQRLGNRLGLAEAFHNMAITYRDLGRLQEADELEQRSVMHARESAEPRMEAHARLGRAEIALRRGDPSWAEASARRVAQDFAAVGDLVRRADALRLAGVACMRQGKHAESVALLDEALLQTRTLGAMLNAAETLRARAELRLAEGDADGARVDAVDALVLFQQLGAEGEAAALRLWMQELPRSAPQPLGSAPSHQRSTQQTDVPPCTRWVGRLRWASRTHREP
jgi:tetratricopeptide (TPR) repeat protein